MKPLFVISYHWPVHNMSQSQRSVESYGFWVVINDMLTIRYSVRFANSTCNYSVFGQKCGFGTALGTSIVSKLSSKLT
jgi:hypothetical protein